MSDNDEIAVTSAGVGEAGDPVGAAPVTDRAETAPPTDARTGSRARRRRLLAVLAFPLLVVVAASVLSAMNLNGSSVALLSPLHRADEQVVAGTPRAIRSDEFAIATPFQVGNVHKAFPTQTWIGLTDTELNATTLGAPTASWLAIVQPSTWPYFVLGVERGFAVRWWLALVLPLVGFYLLLYTLRPRPALAATLAVVIGLSPLTAWWSNGPGPLIGLLALATATVLLALRARSAWASAGLGAVAGYFGCAAFFVLYPPWLVSVGLVMAAVVVGEVVGRRTGLRRVALSVVPAITVLVAVVALWWSQSSVALAALSGTIYPGNRVSESGEGIASVLLGTALNPVFTAEPRGLLPGTGFNQSELSSAWYPLPVLVLIVAMVGVVLVRSRTPRPTVPAATAASTADASTGGIEPVPAPESGVRSWATFIAVSCVMVLELLWMFAPLPAVIGRITLLNRVPGVRVTLALGVCTVLLVHLAAGRLPSPRLAPRLALAVTAAIATGALAWWAARALLVPGLPGVGLALASAAVVALCFSLLVLSPRSWPAMVVLVAVVIANYAIVNPLYRGLGPLTHGELATTLASMAEREGPTKWVDLTEDGSAAVIAASPDELISGLTFYPTREVWERLAPTQETEWNNYSKYAWVPDPTAAPAVIELVKGSKRELRIDLCSPDVAFLDIRYVLSSSKGAAAPACFTPVQTVHDLGRDYTISRRA